MSQPSFMTGVGVTSAFPVLRMPPWQFVLPGCPATSRTADAYDHPPAPRAHARRSAVDEPVIHTDFKGR